jgi:N-acetylglucosamine-6-phosphate deacetylase
MASIITDGHHLPPSVVRSVIAVKRPFHTVITCDASGLAGCPPGVYREGNVAVEILDDGRLVVAGQRQLLAGSGLETDVCVANAVAFAGVSLKDALEMASRNPARLLGFEEHKLRRGSRADLILFRLSRRGGKEMGAAADVSGSVEFRVLATVAAGELRFGTIERREFANSR